MSIQEAYLNATEQDITEFLSELYRGTSEGNLIDRLRTSGKSVTELPVDFEPLHLFGKEDTEGWEHKLSRFDSIILYHGTSTKFQEEIERNGLEPRTEIGNGNFDGGLKSQADSVYLGQLIYFGNIFDSVKMHAYNVTKKVGGLPLIVRAVVPLVDCLPDEDVKRATNGNQSVVYGGTARIKGKVKPKLLFLHPQPEEVLKDPYRARIQQFTFYDFHKQLGSPSLSIN
jgi:hypothetical protein